MFSFQGLIAFLLWGAWASVDDPGPVFASVLILFWVILVLPQGVDIWSGLTRSIKRNIAILERALRDDEVQEVRVASDAIDLYIDICGSFTVYQVESDRMIVVKDRYSCEFPKPGWHRVIIYDRGIITCNSDITILRTIDPKGQWVDLRVLPHGRPITMTPKERYNQKSHHGFKHLEVIQGDLAHLEEQLTRPPVTGKKQT